MNNEGRFPTNVILVHGPECEQTRTDEDGMEEVAQWDCQDNCPVKELQDQSGERPSTMTDRIERG